MCLLSRTSTDATCEPRSPLRLQTWDLKHQMDIFNKITHLCEKQHVQEAIKKFLKSLGGKGATNLILIYDP